MFNPEAGKKNFKEAEPETESFSEKEKLERLSDNPAYKKLLDGYLEYEEKEPVAEEPLIHGTGSFALKKILNEGFKPQKQDETLAGERASLPSGAGDEESPVSFTIPDRKGEKTAHWYALLSSSSSELAFNADQEFSQLNKKLQNKIPEDRTERLLEEVYGGIEEVLDKEIEEEKNRISKAIERGDLSSSAVPENVNKIIRKEAKKDIIYKLKSRQKQEANIFNPELAEEKINSADEILNGKVKDAADAEQALRRLGLLDEFRSYNLEGKISETLRFNTENAIQDLVKDINKGSFSEDNKAKAYFIKRVKQAKRAWEDKLESLQDKSQEEKEEILNQFPCCIILEGESLLLEDSDWMHGVTEKHSESNIPPEKIKEIQVPKSQIEGVKTWVDDAGLEDVKITPFEYYEIKTFISHVSNVESVQQDDGYNHERGQEGGRKMKERLSEVEEELASSQNNDEILDKLKIEKEKLERDIIENYIEESLSGEEGSFIEKPMKKECRVAIMIPVHNEDIETILQPLDSLADQKGVSLESFEVDFIVNNSKKEAEEEQEAFLKNQKIIDFIKSITRQSSVMLEDLPEKKRRIFEKVKESGIEVNVIDKSSLDHAEDENNIGIARNRAGAEVAKRYLDSSDDVERVMAMTDSDCEFSENYVESLIKSFDEHEINGLSGNLEFEVDPNLPNSELTQKVMDVYFDRDKPKKDYSEEEDFIVKEREEKRGTMQAGADMAVKVRSWGLVEGVPNFPGGEDVRFGKKIENLKGKVAKNYGYTVKALLRVSERTGVQGQGRIVKKANESINNFIEGKTEAVFIEDKEKINSFYDALISGNKEDKLDGNLIVSEMEKNDFKENDISKKEFNELAEVINKELAKPLAEQDAGRLENLIFEKIYPYYPEKDVTEYVETVLEKD